MKGKELDDFLQLIERIDAGKGATMPSQSVAAAVRPVFFTTDYEEFLYATDGGTLFLVEYAGTIYGLTCEHVFKGGFPRGRLFVVNEKFAHKGSPPTPIKAFYNPSAPREGAVETDITDLCVIKFGDEVTRATFRGAA